MELKFSACDARSFGMLHMDVHCQDLGFLHLMHLPKIQRSTTMLLGTHHCRSTILVIAWGMSEAEKFGSWKGCIRHGLRFFADGFV